MTDTTTTTTTTKTADQKPTLPSPPNPSQPAGLRVTAETRIPMSLPQMKLQVPDIPGFHCHWMLNEPQRIEQALRAGYTFVEKGETHVPSTGVGADRMAGDGTDLGSRVTVAAGGISENTGQLLRLVLMKLPIEWWDADQKALEAKNDQLVEVLRRGETGSAKGQDRSNRYTGGQTNHNRNLFTKRT